MTGNVVWVTGLSGAGKSTLAKQLVLELEELDFKPIFLDGDSLREVIGANDRNSEDFSKASRLALAMTYCRLCKLLSDQGFLVVIATISMFKEVHAWNREHLSNYFEVYMKASLSRLRERDSKGIYHDFDSQLVNNVAGLDLPVDEPEASDFVGNIEEGTSRDTARKILDILIKDRWLEN